MLLNLHYLLKKLALSGVVAILAGVLVFASHANAQQTMIQAAAPTAQSGVLPSTLLLQEGQDHYALGPNAYVTNDETGRLSYTDLIAGHFGIHHGETTEYNILPLGATASPHWIIMAVKNETRSTSRWILSLGTHADGRYGTFSRVFVYNHLGGNYLLYAMPDKNGVDPKVENLPLTGSGVPFDLAPGRQALLVAYIVPEGGAPVTLAPQIMTEQAYWRSQVSIFSGTAILRMILLASIGYFVGLLILRQSLVSIPFIIYLFAQFMMFEVQNTSPYSNFPFASEMTTLLLTLATLCGLLLSKFFLGIYGRRSKEELIIYALMAGLAILSGMALFSIPDTSVVKSFVLIGLPLATLLLMTLLSVAQALIGKPAAGLMAAGWGVLLAGGLISALSAAGTLSPTIMMINAYWVALVAQCAIFVGASFARVWAIEQGKDEAEETAEEDADAITRIRQAKDGSENARLLKVIEHERSILQELRDRELQQNEEMRRAKDGADMANRAKSAFLAVISHEIRTPMSGIMGMVRLLLDTTLSKDQRDYARTIQDSGDAMLALLNDILDFEKIESGKMDLEIMDFDLMRLVNDIMTLMSGHASQKKIILKADIDPNVPRFVRGDPVRLRQVLLNLTGNAIKFTSEGSVILTVKIPSDMPVNEGWNKIYFGIRDSGIGISKEAQKNLFNPFSQADNSISRKYGGTGLGLAICQRLIEAMGDRIAIDSIEGQGSTFFFTVMMETGQADRVEDMSSTMAARQNQRPERALKVLCVDDNEINLKLLKEFVGRMGHHPTLAGTGEQALGLMKVEQFDMVLMDVELPGISGMGATRAIRALPDRIKAATPVIALTGNVRDEDIRACYAANMNGHLAKPIEPDKLKAQIEKVIHGKLDNPVTLDETQMQSPVVQEVKISDEKPSDSSILSFEDEISDLGGNMPSIRAYALRNEAPPPPSSITQFTESELDEDSFEQALSMEDPVVAAPDSNGHEVDLNVFDHKMLDGLKGSMKPADLKEMVDSLTDKNDEILVALQAAIQGNDMSVISARAHEMKGMSGNFGLKELAGLAAQIEKAARENAPDGLSDIVAALPDATSRSKAALNAWMSS